MRSLKVALKKIVERNHRGVRDHEIHKRGKSSSQFRLGLGQDLASVTDSLLEERAQSRGKAVVERRRRQFGTRGATKAASQFRDATTASRAESENKSPEESYDIHFLISFDSPNFRCCLSDPILAEAGFQGAFDRFNLSQGSHFLSEIFSK